MSQIDKLGLSHIKVIDIGAGTCNMYSKILHALKNLNNESYLEYYGIDRDPIILSKHTDRDARPIRVWGTMNGPSGLEEYYSKYLDNEFEFAVVTLVNSIHYTDDLVKLFESIVRRVRTGYVLIYSMFSDLLSKFDNSVDPEIQIEQIGEQNRFRFNYPWKNNSFTERIYSTRQTEKSISSVRNIEIERELTEEMNRTVDNMVEDIDTRIANFVRTHKFYVLKIG